VKHLSLGVVAAALAVFTAGSVAAQAPAKPAAKVEAGPSCADCHDEAKIFASNPHSRAFRAGHNGAEGNAVCETCHGDGTKHMEAGGDKSLIKTFHGGRATDTCQTCHKQSAERASYWNSVHASSEAVNCLSCHSVHKPGFKQSSLLKSDPNTLCASCHGDVKASFTSMPNAHRLKDGVMSCVNCHDPHGRTANHAVRQTRAGEPGCVSCHSEKRGPFVYPHVTGVVGDCMSCHRPHGSPYSHQLTRPGVAGVCLECHSALSATALGSQPPSFHNLTLPRYANCTTCHTAVHGSQRNPQLLK
jgi:DmsE family decaheme c-type cytochrome